jgi:hypothetical protein
MNLQEKMFSEVEAWMSSGEFKTDYLKGKDYSEAKFNYWLAKWKANALMDVSGGFRELGFTDVKLGKVLEIEAPSGVRITVFA